MKIIDLLNKIANGEEVPEKIEYCRTNFYYDDNGKDYLSIQNQFNDGGISICKYVFSGNLNDEVEILEEEKKIPENLPFKNDMKLTIMEVYHELEKYNYKINEIIDYLKSKGDE